MIRPPDGRLRAHRRERRAGAEERAGEVDGDGVEPRLHVDLVDRAGRAEHARVVEQQVDPAEPVGDRGEQRVHRGGVGDVGGDGEGVRVAVGGGVERVGPPARERHAVLGVEQGPRHDPAQPRARSRHHRHAIRHRPSLPHGARRWGPSRRPHRARGVRRAVGRLAGSSAASVGATRGPAPAGGQPSGAGTVMRAGTGAPKRRAATSLTACTPSASEPAGPTWYMIATV